MNSAHPKRRPVTGDGSQEPSSASSSSPSPLPQRDHPFFLPRRAPHSLTHDDHSHATTAPPHHPTTSSLSLPSSSSSINSSPPSSDSSASEDLTQWRADHDEHKRDDDDDDIDSPSAPTPPVPFPARAPPAGARVTVKKVAGGGGAGVWVRPVQVGRMHDLFRDDIFSVIFSFFDGHTVALLSSVSCEWNELLQDPIIWQSAAFLYWGDHRHSLTLLSRYGDSWKRMVSERPHPRFDGIYVLETKYWKPGAERFGQKLQRIIECCYYRYLHFLPNGALYYALLNQPPSLTTPLPLHHRQLHPAQYLISERGHHLYIKVDVAHETQFFKLQMKETRGEVRSWQGERAQGGAWNRLRVVEFKGKGKKDKDYFWYPLPATEFLFYITSGCQVFEKEEQAERMRTLLESNDDNEPVDA